MSSVYLRAFKILLFIFLFASAIQIATPKQNRSKDEQITNEGEFTLKVVVNLVTTDIAVIGNHKHELNSEDFLLYDNEMPQEITYFSQNELPLAVAILLDTSGSVVDNLPMLQLAALTSLRRLKPGDQVALFTFAGAHQLNSGLTENRLLIADEITHPEKTQGTNIYDTLFEAADYLAKKAPRHRRAIILISDNCHNFSAKQTAPKCSIALLKSAVTLYNLRTYTDDSKMDFCKEPDAAIAKMAGETGGEVIDVDKPAALKGALEKVISRLRAQYTVGFNPVYHEAKGKFHRLKARLSDGNHCPGCRILARSGYFAGASAPESNPQAVPQSSPDALASEDEKLMEKSVNTAGIITDNFTSIPFDASAAEESSLNGLQQIKIDLSINAGAIRFETKDDQWSGNLRIGLFSVDENKKILGVGEKRLQLRLSSEEYGQATKLGIPYSVLMPWISMDNALKIVVYDEADDQIGSKIITLPGNKK